MYKEIDFLVFDLEVFVQYCSACYFLPFPHAINLNGMHFVIFKISFFCENVFQQHSYYTVKLFVFVSLPVKLDS